MTSDVLRIGLTGGIGSGKSTVANLFSRLGVPVIDADIIAREIVAPGQPAFHKVTTAFGKQILGQDGEIDRQRLSGIVFRNEESRRHLESILHPMVRQAIESRVRLIDAPYCVIVVPLLIEAEFTDLVDRVLVVDASETDQIERVRQRNGLPEEDIRRIIRAQASRSDRRAAASDIIENASDLAHLEKEVDRLNRSYLVLARGAAHPGD